MIKIYINDPVYRVNPTVFLNCTAQELKTHVEKAIGEELEDFDAEKEDKDNSYGVVWQFEDRKGGSYSVLWLKKFTWEIPSLASLVHETRHLADTILKQRGVALTEMEATAYYHEFLFSTILKEITKHEDKKKKIKKR